MGTTRRAAVLAAGVGALVASSALIAWAQIPGQNGIISGCYGKSSGVLRVVSESDACKSGETGLSWNQAGQPGPEGPAGPQGPAGPDELLRANVSADGTLTSGDATSVTTYAEPGTYTVAFARDVSDCTFAVTPGDNPGGAGYVIDNYTANAVGFSDGTVLVVMLRGDTGQNSDTGFHLLVAC